MNLSEKIGDFVLGLFKKQKKRKSRKKLGEIATEQLLEREKEGIELFGWISMLVPFAVAVIVAVTILPLMTDSLEVALNSSTIANSTTGTYGTSEVGQEWGEIILKGLPIIFLAGAAVVVYIIYLNIKETGVM